MTRMRALGPGRQFNSLASLVLEVQIPGQHNQHNRHTILGPKLDRRVRPKNKALDSNPILPLPNSELPTAKFYSGSGETAYKEISITLASVIVWSFAIKVGPNGRRF